jgi:hypothetical protein
MKRSAMLSAYTIVSNASTYHRIGSGRPTAKGYEELSCCTRLAGLPDGYCCSLQQEPAADGDRL